MSLSSLSRAALAGALLTAALAPAAHAAQPGAGAFMSECAECHSVAPGKNKRGPSLAGVVGRGSAAVPGYKYSDAMAKARWTWDAATLRRYLSQPSDKALPGTKMEYDGLSDPQQLEAIIAYLGTLR